jgi:hypothetical protein
MQLKMKAYTIYNAPVYDEWLEEQPAKSQVQIRERISHIQDDGYFGDHKGVEDDVWELRRKFCYSWEGIKMGKIKISARRRRFSTNISRSKDRHIMKLKKDTGINPTCSLPSLRRVAR